MLPCVHMSSADMRTRSSEGADSQSSKCAEARGSPRLFAGRASAQRDRSVYVLHEKLEGVFVFEIIEDQITNLYAMRNPDKLVGITVPRVISRS